MTPAAPASEKRRIQPWIVLRKFRTLVWILWHSILGFATLGLALLLRPFRLIRFGHVYSSRIGHFIYNIDNYLSDRRRRESNELAIFSAEKRIANQTVLALWRRQPNLFFSQGARPATWVLARFFPNSPMTISWERELHPLGSEHSASAPSAEFSEEEKREGAALLASRGIERPFVCLHNRDSAYLDVYGGDGNPHDFRDSNFDDFTPAIERLFALGYSVVRLGEIVKSEAAIDDPRFHSVTGSLRTDFSDVFLASEGSFFVGGSSGFSQVPRLFRKPTLLVNYIPFWLPDLTAWSAGSVIIPKKLYSRKQDRFLKFSEMADLPYDIHYKGDFFGDLGLDVVDNSPDELADAVLEMESRVSGRWADSADQQRLHSSFWQSLGQSELVPVLRDTLKTTLGSLFLERNQELI